MAKLTTSFQHDPQQRVYPSKLREHSGRSSSLRNSSPLDKVRNQKRIIKCDQGSFNLMVTDREISKKSGNRRSQPVQSSELAKDLARKHGFQFELVGRDVETIESIKIGFLISSTEQYIVPLMIGSYPGVGQRGFYDDNPRSMSG
jgi:hypothetical protein